MSSISALPKELVESPQSPWQQARSRFFAGRQGPIGLGILIFIVLFCVIGRVLLPYSFYDLPQPDVLSYMGRGPSLAHPFGETARTQRDVLTLVVNGGVGSLTIGFV